MPHSQLSLPALALVLAMMGASPLSFAQTASRQLQRTRSTAPIIRKLMQRLPLHPHLHRILRRPWAARPE
jgi:hypothetical protein